MTPNKCSKCFEVPSFESAATDSAVLSVWTVKCSCNRFAFYTIKRSSRDEAIREYNILIREHYAKERQNGN